MSWKNNLYDVLLSTIIYYQYPLCIFGDIGDSHHPSKSAESPAEFSHHFRISSASQVNSEPCVHFLLINMHHSVTDGRSLAIFRRKQKCVPSGLEMIGDDWSGQAWAQHCLQSAVVEAGATGRECFRMFQNVSECFRMFQIFEKAYRKSPW